MKLYLRDHFPKSFIPEDAFCVVLHCPEGALLAHHLYDIYFSVFSNLEETQRNLAKYLTIE